MEAILWGKQLRDDMIDPFLRGKVQRPSERRLNNNGLSVDLLDLIATPREQGEVLEKRERVYNVDNPSEWEEAKVYMEEFECG